MRCRKREKYIYTFAHTIFAWFSLHKIEQLQSIIVHFRRTRISRNTGIFALDEVESALDNRINL